MSMIPVISIIKTNQSYFPTLIIYTVLSIIAMNIVELMMLF